MKNDNKMRKEQNKTKSFCEVKNMFSSKFYTNEKSKKVPVISFQVALQLYHYFLNMNVFLQVHKILICIEIFHFMKTKISFYICIPTRRDSCRHLILCPRFELFHIKLKKK